MIAPSDEERIQHIVQACQDIETFVTQESDLHDRKTSLAVAKCYEIIGEAANHVSPAIRAEITEVDWGAMIGMRDKITHQHFDVEQYHLFRAAVRKVPPLRQTLEKWLKQQS